MRSRLDKHARSLWLERLERRDLLATVELLPVADNTLFEDSGGSLSNGVGQHLFAGRVAARNGATIRRGLLEFDLASAQIPDGATIDRVSLSLHVSKSAPGSGSQAMALHRVLSEWGEGPSNAGSARDGGGAAAATGDATWLHRAFNDTFWASPGGDFAAAASATAQVGGVGGYTWSSDGLMADVEAWLDDPQTEFGWVLIGNEDTPQTAKRFNAREHPTDSLRPRLTIEFTASNASPTDVTIDNDSIDENAGPAEALIGILTAVDGDDGDTHTFQLVSGAGDEDNALVRLSGDRLELAPGTQLDHETNDRLLIRVEATDAAGASVEKSLTILVADVNERPTVNTPVRNHYAVEGDSLSHSLPATTFVDQDADDALTVTAALESGAGLPSWLSFDSNTLTFSGEPTASDVSLQRIRVTAADSGDPALTVDATFVLAVTSSTSPWLNPENALDVDLSGLVIPLDVLIVVNALNEQGSGLLPDRPTADDFLLDVNGDGTLAPLDVLLIVNSLVQEGEGESPATQPTRSLFVEVDAAFAPTAIAKTRLGNTARREKLDDTTTRSEFELLDLGALDGT